MHEAPRYQSLRDYLRVIREHRVLVLICVVLLGAAALALSLRQERVYRAEAALAFQDVNADVGDLGAAIPLSQTAEQRAAVGAQRVTEISIARDARAKLRTKEKVTDLLDAVDANAEARTNLVVVRATWGDPEFAARIANAFADATRDQQLNTARVRYRRRAKELRRTLRQLPSGRTSELTESLTRDRIARFENLARLAEPVVLAVRADAPDAPFSPKPVRNILLGLLAGLTLGLVAAFVRDALDRRIRGGDELREGLHLPVLAEVGEDVLGRSAAASDNGHKALTGTELEPFRILRRNLDFLDVDRRPDVVLVTSALPEEGKTTVAGALAAAHALADRRVVLLECDLRRPTVAERWRLKASPGLTDGLVGDSSWSEIVQSVTVRPGDAGTNGNGKRRGAAEAPGAELAVITAGSPSPQPAELLGSQRFREILAELRATYDVVVIDAPPLLPVVDALELVPQVDGVLLCVRSGQTTRDQARSAKAALDHFPPRPTGVVLTGARPDRDDAGYYSYAYREPAAR